VEAGLDAEHVVFGSVSAVRTPSDIESLEGFPST